MTAFFFSSSVLLHSTFVSTGTKYQKEDVIMIKRSTAQPRFARVTKPMSPKDFAFDRLKKELKPGFRQVITITREVCHDGKENIEYGETIFQPKHYKG